jgi:hypothetical protein
MSAVEPCPALPGVRAFSAPVAAAFRPAGSHLFRRGVGACGERSRTMPRPSWGSDLQVRHYARTRHSERSRPIFSWPFASANGRSAQRGISLHLTGGNFDFNSRLSPRLFAAKPGIRGLILTKTKNLQLKTPMHRCCTAGILAGSLAFVSARARTTSGTLDKRSVSRARAHFFQ